MHELGIVQNLLNTALAAAASNQAAGIRQLNIQVSAMADESEDSIRFHFEHLARGTMAEHARLNIIHVPLQAKCLECDRNFAWTEMEARCPFCSSAHVQAVLDEGWTLTSIEVE